MYNKMSELYQVITFIFTVITIVGNYVIPKYITKTSISQITKEIIPVSIQPDGWAFSIWGIIYTILILICILKKNMDTSFLIMFGCTCIFNLFWIYLFTTKRFFVSFFTLLCLCSTIFMLIWYNWNDTTIWFNVGLSVYGSWTLGATLLNLIIFAQQTSGNQASKWIGLGLFFAVHTINVIIYSILYFTQSPISDNYGKICIPILLVALWTSIGIVTKHNYGIWLTISFIFYLFYLLILVFELWK